MRLVTALFATLGAALAFAPAALAADVDAQDPSRWIRVRANDREVNRLTLSHAAGVVTVSDDAGDLTAGAGCHQVSAHEVRCTITDGEARVDASLGDGDDEATVLGALPAKLDGGPGNDRLTGGDAADKLSGGDGADRLDGGAAVDEFDAGEGDDALVTRDGLREAVLCGGGTDAGAADVEDDVAADCEQVEKPLPPAGLDAVQPAAAPVPAPGRTVAVAAKEGTVLARVPGASAFAPLDPTKPLPVGAVVDARRGVATLTAAADLVGATQTADFRGGRFRVGQRRAASMTTELRLTGGDFASCPKPRPRAREAVARAASGRVVRRLWGSGKGRFRTRGRNSAATVRGTIWTVEDRCDGTLTRVTRGVVVVENLRTGRTKVVRAGESVLVRRRAAR
ncbi:MAG TPA: calcium-binding protein [Solirubrobacteraceae bacterium]